MNRFVVAPSSYTNYAEENLRSGVPNLFSAFPISHYTSTLRIQQTCRFTRARIRTDRGYESLALANCFADGLWMLRWATATQMPTRHGSRQEKEVILSSSTVNYFVIGMEKPPLLSRQNVRHIQQ
jgi:hypothetical protein